MPRPGSDVILQDTAGSIATDSDTGTLFIPGTTDRGPTTPTLIQSLAQFVDKFGARQSYSILYDYLDEYFREGGAKAYVARVVGPGATSGSLNLLDGSSAISLVATAVGPGAWSSSYKVAVVAGTGSNFQIQVTDASNNVLESSGDLADQQSAVNWSQNSDYIRLTLGVATDNPALLAHTALSAGNDDRSNITDTQWDNALASFPVDLGPGQLVAPGRTSTTAYNQLITHAEATDRVALLDLPDSATQATLKSAISTLTARPVAAFAGWLNIPALTGGAQYRIVPPTALVAGLIARNDPSFGPNRPSAGKAGIARYAVGLTQSQAGWDYTDLMNAGINPIRIMKNALKVYGWRSMADPVNDPSWIDFGNARLFMAISKDLDDVAQEYVFEDIDGQNGTTIGNFHSDLAGVLMGYYNSKQLFGSTPEEAFAVDTGPQVNTLTTIAALEIHAVCYVKMAPFAEYIQIPVVKRQVTEAIV